MPTINLPAENTIISPQVFSLEPIEHILDELCAPGHDFSGYIKVTSGEKLYLLFFYNSRPYAAAKSISHSAETISLRDFFSTLGALQNSKAMLSIHATDHVLLKSLLIFFQNKPVVTARANLLDLAAISSQIRKETTDALIVLKKAQEISLFFFKHGTPGISYSSDPEFSFQEDRPIEELMLAYASKHGGQATASIFRNTTTTEDKDALVFSQSEMLRLLRGNSKDEHDRENLVLKVLRGAHAGEILTGSIPSILGRKDTDIIVNDPLVSKRHAAVQLVNGKLFLMDLNSTNGTFVNGNRIKQHEILLGDVIMLGETTLSVEKLSPPS